MVLKDSRFKSSESISHRRRSEFESAGADWNVRGCRHRNAKI